MLVSLQKLILLLSKAVCGEEYLRRKPIDNEAPTLSFDRTHTPAPRVTPQPNRIPVENTVEVPQPVDGENHEQNKNLEIVFVESSEVCLIN